MIHLRKFIVLTCCTGNRRCDSNGELNRGSNHKSLDLKVRFERPKKAIWGKVSGFGLRDFNSLAICDLEHLAFEVIYYLAVYFKFARLFLETLQKDTIKQT